MHICLSLPEFCSLSLSDLEIPRLCTSFSHWNKETAWHWASNSTHQGFLTALQSCDYQQQWFFFFFPNGQNFTLSTNKMDVLEGYCMIQKHGDTKLWPRKCGFICCLSLCLMFKTLQILAWALSWPLADDGKTLHSSVIRTTRKERLLKKCFTNTVWDP